MPRVEPADPSSPVARGLQEALWVEIQRRYGFTAPNPFDPASFRGPIGGFWIATDIEGLPMGCVGLTPLAEPGVAELDVMYVEASHRRRGAARALLAAVDEHATAHDLHTIRLRAGDPQPEAMALYAAAGYRPIPPFGHWVGDETARCLEKRLAS